MSFPERALKLLRSQKLALVLLILLAAVAVVGTPWPAEKAGRLFVERFGADSLPAARFFGFVDTYRSPVFIGLLLLFAANVALCTWYRFSLRRAAGRGAEGVGRTMRRWLDLLMHLSVIVILLGGAVKGIFAEVGTQYLFVDVETDTVYDVEAKSDVPLGFTLLMKERVEDYYPLQVQVGVSDASTGGKLALLELREGGVTSLPGRNLRVSIGEYDIDSQWVAIRAKTGGISETLRLDIAPGGQTSAGFREYVLTLVAWRQDLKRVRGLVTVLDQGQEVKEEWLSPNGRIGYMGKSIFLTTWGEDEYRNPYLGIQVTKDPGAVIFWIGATLLSLTLPLLVIVRHRGRT